MNNARKMKTVETPITKAILAKNFYLYPTSLSLQKIKQNIILDIKWTDRYENINIEIVRKDPNR